MNIKMLKDELKKLKEGKIADYERYKSGEISREKFIERKQLSDGRKIELESAVAELEAQSLICNADQKENEEAFEIKKHLHLESFDKAVMASLIASAKVTGEDCLEVAWKNQDVYEKILSITYENVTFVKGLSPFYEVDCCFSKKSSYKNFSDIL